MSSFMVVISGVVGLWIPVITICCWMITHFTYNSCLNLMSDWICFSSEIIAGLQPYPMAGPEGAFQGLLQLRAGFSSNIKSSKYNLNMAVTTLKALAPLHPRGKMAAKAAMLYVPSSPYTRAARQVLWPVTLGDSPSLDWTPGMTLDKPLNPPVPWCLLHTFLVILTWFWNLLILFWSASPNVFVHLLPFLQWMYLSNWLWLLWQEIQSNLPSHIYLFLALAHLVNLASAPLLSLFYCCLHYCLFTVGSLFHPTAFLD